METITSIFNAIWVAYALVIFSLIILVSAYKDEPNELVIVAHVLDFVMKTAVSAWILYATIYFLNT